MTILPPRCCVLPSMFLGLAGVLAAQAAPLAPAEGPAAEPDAVQVGDRPLQRVDRQANEYESSSQEAASLARTTDGRTLLVWHSRRQQVRGSYGVYGRLFGPDGDPLTGEVKLNGNEEGDQTFPAAAATPDGSLWVAWQSWGHDGEQGAIVARRFAADLGGATVEVLVNAEARGHQEQPAIAALADGGALVAWTSPDAESGLKRVLVQRLDAAGTPLGDPIAVDRTDAAQDGFANLGVLPDGFVCVWARTTDAGVPTGVHARAFAADGTPRGAAFALSVEEGQHIEPALAVDPRGDLAVAWLTADGGNYELRLRRFALDGEGAPRLGDVTAPDTAGPGYLSGHDLALGAAGELLVAWCRFGDDQRYAGLFAQLFDAANEPASDRFRATAVERGHQRLHAGHGTRRLFLGDDGSMAFAWSGFAGDTDESAAALTLLVPEGLRLASVEAEPVAADALRPLEEGARPHDPPIRSSGRVSMPPVQAPTPGSGFTGITQTGLTPPDPEIGVGPGHVVLIVNDGIAFYTKAGVQTYTDTISLPGGFYAPTGNIGGLVFDPEALYDPHTDRFFVMANQRGNNGQAYFLLAVSDDSDPNGSWNQYRFNVTAAAGNDGGIDSPNMAVDDSYVYLTADFFSGGTKYLVWVVEKAPTLVGGVPATASNLISGMQSIGIPLTYDAGAPAQYMIESFESGTNNAVKFWAMTDPLNPSNVQTFTLSVPTYAFPEDPPQLGTSVRPELFEPRFWSCLYINGSLWATHHVNAQRVRQRWYEFDMRGWPTSGQNPVIAQSGEVDAGGEIRTFFGSIAADFAGNVALNFSRSSPTEFISMQYVTRTISDAAGTTSPMTLAQASTSADTSGRWGDYSGVQLDPTRTGGFMAHGEYRTGSWATWVEPIETSDPPLVYCTAKVSSSGCLAAMTTSAPLQQPASGADDYDVITNSVEGTKNGLVFFSIQGPAALPFQGGTLCVQPPTQRTPVQFAGGAAGTCTGQYSLRINDQTIPNLDLGPGTPTWFQTWYRNPELMDGFDVALSDALMVTYQ